jgi:hypothetical protein
MIHGMKRDLTLIAQGIGIAFPLLFIAAFFSDVDPRTWPDLLVAIGIIVLAAIPITRDAIAQAKRREREGLR